VLAARRDPESSGEALYLAAVRKRWRNTRGDRDTVDEAARQGERVRACERPPRESTRRRGDGEGDALLLTGATGFLGGELLVRYLERTNRRVFALVRATSQHEATARVRRTLNSLFGPRHPHGERVVAVQGDITRPDLGLSHHGYELAERVSEIVHGAATVSFTAPLDVSRAVNLHGTRRMLEFAARCRARGGLRRFTYISTAYVAGEHDGRFSEDDLCVGQRFRNPYERSKFEAECLLSRWRGEVPLTVVRPSIIVGERGSGWTSSFNVLYWPLRAFSQGTYLAVPARGGAPVDVVPVDYVADAIFALGEIPSANATTLHLTAGRHASIVAEVVALASAFFRRPAPRLVDPALYRRVLHPVLLRAVRDARQRRALRHSEAFFPYFDTRVSYDNRHARALLHATGIEPTPLRSYFDQLAEFALIAAWGSRPVPRARTGVAPADGRRAVVTRQPRRRLELAV
jgi:thioester reductase-like protein